MRNGRDPNKTIKYYLLFNYLCCMIAPKLLKKGDKVGIISTARKIRAEEVQPAIDQFMEWGLKVVKGKNLHSEYNQFAGTEQERALDLQEMLNDSEIKAIFCARGGYGTVQIIDEIDWSFFKRKPKWIVGYSDITVLHSHIQRVCNIESIHAVMPVNFNTTEITNEAVSSLKNALFKGKNKYIIPSHPFNRPGIIQAPVSGGNLSILYSLLGSRSEVKSRNSILFIEDLDEYLYHIDRMMMNLERNDKLRNIKGIMIGGMCQMNDNSIPFGKSAIDIISEKLSRYKYPVCFNFPAGHIADNRAIIMGRNSILEVENDQTIFTQ